ncbi:MAG: helix-turn-helix transcriptional regulator [Clostridia bacterium]|nr:helix-turn-helix transcriptional regulator [Clostridia bacterium]
MKYLFRDRISGTEMLSAFFKDSSDTHPDHHDYHPHFELYFRRRPLPQQITLNGETFHVETPAIVLTAPFQIHAMSPAFADCTRYERHIVYFNERLIELAEGLLPHDYFATHANCLFLLTEQQAEHLGRDLPLIFDRSLPERERALLFILLLLRLNRTVSTEQRRSFGQINAYIPQVLHYLYDHVQEDLNSEHIAALFHVSRAKLNRDFRASVGQSLHSAIMDLRLSRAAALLRDSNLTVNEIAIACGFSSAYYFHSFFKRATGTTPLSYRKKDEPGL